MNEKKNPTHDILISRKLEYEASLDASQKKVFRNGDLKELLKPFRVIQKSDSFLDGSRPIIAQKDIIKFLLAQSYLKKVEFNLYREETIFIWRDASSYLLLPVLRPQGYYSHLSALYFNGLVEREPKDVFYNCEQITHTKLGDLEQSRIDMAFKNRQRETKAKTVWDNKVFWYVNGKQTKNYGVTSINISPGVSIPVTNIERTLVDIVVRPVYSGGPRNVLTAFRKAKPKISIEKLVQTLKILNYTYPYHQSIGFYLDLAGYGEQAISALREFNSINFDFYLDYQISEPCFDERWRIYYPHDLI